MTDEQMVNEMRLALLEAQLAIYLQDGRVGGKGVGGVARAG